MSLPQFVEVRIKVADLQSAIVAWAASSGLNALTGEDPREAVIEVGDCIIRLIESPDETPGLSGVTLAFSELPETVERLADALAGGATASIRPGSSHGVPIDLIEAEP